MKKTKKRTPYWFRILAPGGPAEKRAAKGLEPFTKEQQLKAEDWQTCACGKQDPIIPRQGFNKAPVDFRLEMAGLRFYRAVSPEAEGALEADGLTRVRAARRILGEIEEHAIRVVGKELKRLVSDARKLAKAELTSTATW